LNSRIREADNEALKPDWPVCANGHCIGVRVSNDTCLTHLDENERAAFLEKLHPGSDIDLRGTQISEVLLKRLLAALTDDKARPRVGQALFEGARFNGQAWFMQVHFSGPARFQQAQFDLDANFGSVRFGDQAVFMGARFDGSASFVSAQFDAEALFLGTQFNSKILSRRSFWRAGTTFYDHGAFFTEAQFRRYADFGHARFSGPAGFDHAEFEGETDFKETQFGSLASFVRTRFSGPESIGPLCAAGHVVLDKAIFDKTIQIEIAAAALTIVQAIFRAGATIRVRYAAIAADRATFAQPIILAAASPFTLLPSTPMPFPSWNEEPSAPPPLDETSLRANELDPRPRVVSLRGVDVANLVVIDINLGSCLFAGAHHLDQLRLEGSKVFTDAPRGIHTGWTWPPIWWWTRRQTLAEERLWRATRRKAQGWSPAGNQSPEWLTATTGEPPTLLGPERIATLYRALRKAQEDTKHEPGAADFYYGEMEMRRHASSSPWGERVIMSLYWLTAGYGLRGLRALGCLAALIVLLGTLVQHLGFEHARPTLWASLLYTVQSTLSLEPRLRSLSLALTWEGEVLRILLRLIGPVLLGLALLSVRNRVKR
jgi:uncharacterized protein YjbI with pentapeptide repeats